MKIQRRSFIRSTIAGTALVSMAGLFPGSILKGCNPKTASGQKNDSNQNSMKKLIVKEIHHQSAVDLDLAEKLLERDTGFQSVETINWPEYPYKPDVKFRIAYCQDQILLKYYVNEESIRAKETRVNGDVHKDSCVEFFISTNGNDTYYNFEFSCIGMLKVGYGQERTNRILIDPKILKQLTTRSSLGNQPFEEKTGGHQWEMMIVIPAACLTHDKDIILKGLKAHANFYKCGDETSKPHFVSWNPVGTDSPDYHQSAYFGELSFE